MNHQPIQIRVLHSGDEAVLDNIAPDVFDDVIDPSSTHQFLADQRHHLVVALDAGLVVGFASGVHYLHPDKPSPELFINEVGIAAAYQGRGIAKQVMAALLDCGRGAGCRQAWVLTGRDNVAAMKLYAAVGGKEGPSEHVMFDFVL